MPIRSTNAVLASTTRSDQTSRGSTETRSTVRTLILSLLCALLLLPLLISAAPSAEGLARQQGALFTATPLITTNMIQAASFDLGASMRHSSLANVYDEALLDRSAGCTSETWTSITNYPQNFGGYVTQAVGDDLYIGLAPSTPNTGCGAMIVSYNQNRGIQMVGVLKEQGVRDFTLAGDYLFINSSQTNSGTVHPDAVDALSNVNTQKGQIYRFDTSQPPSNTNTITRLPMTDTNGAYAVDANNLINPDTGNRIFGVAHSAGLVSVEDKSLTPSACGELYYTAVPGKFALGSHTFTSSDCGNTWTLVMSGEREAAKDFFEFNDALYSPTYTGQLEKSVRDGNDHFTSLAIDPTTNSKLVIGTNVEVYTESQVKASLKGNAAHSIGGRPINWVEFNNMLVSRQSDDTLVYIDANDTVGTVPATGFSLGGVLQSNRFVVVDGHLYTFDASTNRVMRTNGIDTNPGPATNWNWQVAAEIAGPKGILSISSWEEKKSIVVTTMGSDANVYQINVAPRCRNRPVTVELSKGEVPTDGDDVILGTAAADRIVAGGGNDVVCALGGNDTIYGGPGNDTIDAGDGADVVHGQAGNDVIRGNRGDDRITGNQGDDVLYGNRDKDKLWGRLGNDTLHGGLGADQLYGGADDDTLHGGASIDWLQGGAGSDDCNGGTSWDSASTCETLTSVERTF